MKQYVGISRDHSGSMHSITKAAARDYNNTIQAIREQSTDAGIDTIVSVVRFGDRVEREVINSSVNAVKPLAESAYHANMGMTALVDSVGDLIEQFEKTPDATDPNVTFMVMAVTDGGENQSRKYSWRTLAEKIRKLQQTDRWTFIFRVPRGYASEVARHGVPAGNILEWDQTDRGVEAATQATVTAFKGFYEDLKSGKARSTDRFYTNVADLTSKEVKKTLVDISSQVNLWQVAADTQIRPFCEGKLSGPMVKGAAFYQLTKKEDEVQDYKQIAVRDKKSGAVYTGAAARDMLGLPQYGMAKVAPGDHGQWDIYIQSTSVNRKLPAGTTLLYWPYAGITK